MSVVTQTRVLKYYSSFKADTNKMVDDGFDADSIWPNKSLKLHPLSGISMKLYSGIIFCDFIT